MPITVCGIKNCDTGKKAHVWLDKHDSVAFPPLGNSRRNALA